MLVFGNPPSRNRLVVAWLAGWLVFVAASFLVLAYILPGLIWLAAFALLVPVLVTENVTLRAAIPRALRLARGDVVHQVGTLLTLAVLAI